MTVISLLSRPQPPYMEPLQFITRAKELEDWIITAILTNGGPLYNEDHEHLLNAYIGCLWTNVDNSKKGRTVVGQAELPLQSRGGKWETARAKQQLMDLFGRAPDFLLTFHAECSREADDASFCALVEHELYHCAQDEDGFGSPKFNTEGEPVWCIKGHDVEQFIGVVRRYGAEASGVVELAIAAASEPEVAKARISQSCALCAKR